MVSHQSRLGQPKSINNYIISTMQMMLTATRTATLVQRPSVGVRVSAELTVEL